MTSLTKSKNEPNSKATKSTKKAQLIALLSRKSGGTVAEASEKLGWQHHTTRAALSGLRKAGYEIDSRKSKDGKLSTYHIIGQRAEGAA